MRPLILPLIALASLTACGSVNPVGGGAGAGGGVTRAGAEVPTDGYETYVTQHNGFTRIRRSDTETGDAEVLRQFEDSNPASPAGFRNMIDLQSTPVRGRVQAEAIGQMRTWNGGQSSALQRILRLTTDVEDFNPANIARAGGEIVLAGSDYTVVRFGGGDPIFANQSGNGSLYLAVNFDTETAAIRILNRTIYQHCGQCTPEDLFRVDLLGENLPFNVQTGAFGGEITGEVYQLMVRLGSRSGEVSGTILGNIGGAARDDLVAGGVFEASGTIVNPHGPAPLDVDVGGLFWASN